jgi:4-hydroxyproline epimerase
MDQIRHNHDAWRRAILCEPRGSDVIVGAYLLEPDDKINDAAVLFFNNAGYLGMCGHGMIGLAVTLAHLGHIRPGDHRVETPVGIVDFHLHSPHCATIRNVPAYRHLAAVTVDVPGYGPVTGDVAWGGNWFFLVGRHPYDLNISQVEPLTNYTWAIRKALAAAGITGADGAEIDHIELYTGPQNSSNHARNFVLCPGKAYDRSPCGTGTSAKMACLAADGHLAPGQSWRQEGILGTVFEGSYRWAEDRRKIIPSITGTAYVTAQSTLLFDPDDPFQMGVPE